MGEELYRRRTVYEHVRDMQAERDAALGAAARERVVQMGLVGEDAWLELGGIANELRENGNDVTGLVQTIADALEEEKDG